MVLLGFRMAKSLTFCQCDVITDPGLTDNVARLSLWFFTDS